MNDDADPVKRALAARDGPSRARLLPNSHVRLAGTVRFGPRYAFLEIADGSIWRLRSDDDLADHRDRLVTVEATVAASDELMVLWIGAGETGEVP